MGAGGTKPVSKHGVTGIDGCDLVAPHLVVHPTVKMADGSEWAHEDYKKVVEPWAVEQHIGPINSRQWLGTVESWVDYVKRYGRDGADVRESLLTWTEAELKAVLDYHSSMGEAGRCQWVALHTFEASQQWQEWQAVIKAGKLDQRTLVENLDDLAEDILAPDPSQLQTILSNLRAHSSGTAESVLRPDGTTKLSWTKDQRLSGELELPENIVIGIPVLKQQQIEGPKYEIKVRLRAHVDDGDIFFRLSMPAADRLWARVVNEQVENAKTLLGDLWTILAG